MHTKINPHLIKNALYTLRIVFRTDAIDVFLNNIQAIHIPQSLANNYVSNIGIKTFNTVADFEHLRIAGTNFTINSGQSEIPGIPWLLDQYGHMHTWYFLIQLQLRF